MLWTLDHIANPNGLLVGKMTVAYSGSEVEVPLPAAWSEIETDLLRRIEAADESSLRQLRPLDRLTACSDVLCPSHVRGLWDSDPVDVERGSFGDAEVTVIARVKVQ